MGGLTAVLVWQAFGSTIWTNALAFILIVSISFYMETRSEFKFLTQVALVNFIVIYFEKWAKIANGNDNVKIFDVALIRTLSITLAVFLGLAFTWLVWPVFARTTLRVDMSNLFNDLSLLFKKLSNTMLVQSNNENASPNIFEFLALEFKIQQNLMQNKEIARLSVKEPRLRGPFPKAQYDQLISSCQFLLDRMLSFRMAAFKETSPNFKSTVQPLMQASTDRLVTSVLIDMYTFSGALLLKKPLPPNLFASENARIEMIENIRKTPGAIEKIVLNGDIHYVFVYYALKDIVKELEKVRNILVELFGEQHF